MAKEKDKTSGASAAAPAKDAPAPAAPAIPAEAPKRSRFSFSKDQKLAFVLSGLIGILGTEAIAKLLTDEQKAKVNTLPFTFAEKAGHRFRLLSRDVPVPARFPLGWWRIVGVRAA